MSIRFYGAERNKKDTHDRLTRPKTKVWGIDEALTQKIWRYFERQCPDFLWPQSLCQPIIFDFKSQVILNFFFILSCSEGIFKHRLK